MKNLDKAAATTATNINSIHVATTKVAGSCVSKLETVCSVEKYFTEIMAADTNMSAAIAAIKTLLRVLEDTNCKQKKIKFKYNYELISDLCNT